MSFIKFLPTLAQKQLLDDLPTADGIEKAKILVVEPDAGLTEMLSEVFADYGYEYKIIPYIDDIRPIVASFNPDLVLIEYLLPIVNGGELCTQLKEDPRFSDLPVMLYSAYPQLLWSINDYGCDSFIAKPFDLDELTTKIAKLIGQS
jgi:two-component system response regulator VicR